MAPNQNGSGMFRHEACRLHCSDRLSVYLVAAHVPAEAGQEESLQGYRPAAAPAVWKAD